MPLASRNAGATWARVVVLAAALGGCGWSGLGKSDDVWKQDPNKVPADYKAELLAYLRTALPDPTSIREAYIAEPALKEFGKENRYAVCVRYNAKNRDGQYAGSKDAVAVYFAGRFNQLVEATRDQCATAAYQPFPELERLTRLDAH